MTNHDDFSGAESLFSRQLATCLFPDIWAAANQPGILSDYARLEPGVDFPFFTIWAKRLWWPPRAWRTPHARGVRLDPKAFKYALRKGGLLGCWLREERNARGEAFIYYVVYRKPAPTVKKPPPPTPPAASEPEPVSP
jgi:hypothetical protein